MTCGNVNLTDQTNLYAIFTSLAGNECMTMTLSVVSFSKTYKILKGEVQVCYETHFSPFKEFTVYTGPSPKKLNIMKRSIFFVTHFKK